MLSRCRSQVIQNKPSEPASDIETPIFKASPSPLSYSTASVADERRMNSDELARIINDPKKGGYDEIVIVDARYPYEYEGGHIKHAVNVTTQQQLIDLYNLHVKRNVCFVFHCEYSSQRGPKVMSFFRHIDRMQNVYPNLSFPSIFILRGGYATFYGKYPELCIGGYEKMNSPKHYTSGALNEASQIFLKNFDKINAEKIRRRTIQRSFSQCCSINRP